MAQHRMAKRRRAVARDHIFKYDRTQQVRIYTYFYVSGMPGALFW